MEGGRGLTFGTLLFAEERTEGGELGEVYIICRQDIKLK